MAGDHGGGRQDGGGSEGEIAARAPSLPPPWPSLPAPPRSLLFRPRDTLKSPRCMRECAPPCVSRWLGVFCTLAGLFSCRLSHTMPALYVNIRYLGGLLGLLVLSVLSWDLAPHLDRCPCDARARSLAFSGV